MTSAFILILISGVGVKVTLAAFINFVKKTVDFANQLTTHTENYIITFIKLHESDSERRTKLMLNIKLNDHFSTPAYPKKNAYAAFDYDEKQRRWLNVLDWSAIYDNPWFYKQLVQDAAKEIQQVTSEQQPCKVMLANLALLFWAFKGPCYNYGGFSKISNNSVSDLHLNRNYITDTVYLLADQTRNFLESSMAEIFSKLTSAPDRDLLPNAELLYDKLLLLLYDLITGATIYFVSGELSSTDLGTTAYTDILGTTRFSNHISLHDDRTVEYKTGLEAVGREKYQAYCQVRPQIAAEVKRLSPGYPADQNTWQYYRIDINEISPIIQEIYGISIPDLTNDEKREKMTIHSKVVGSVGEFYKDAYGMIPVFGKFAKKGLEKAGMGKYAVGSVSKEEQPLRQYIYLFR